MAQRHFDLQNKNNLLEGLNAEVVTENEVLKQKVADLGFEVVLLKDVCNLDDTEQTDALIEELRQNIRDENVQLCALQLSIADKESESDTLKTAILEKDAEIANLTFTFSAATPRMNPDDLLDNYNQAEPNAALNEDEQNEKMGEDIGEDSIAGRTKRSRQKNPTEICL